MKKTYILDTDATSIYAYIPYLAPWGWHANNPIHLSISKESDHLFVSGCILERSHSKSHQYHFKKEKQYLKNLFWI